MSSLWSKQRYVLNREGMGEESGFSRPVKVRNVMFSCNIEVGHNTSYLKDHSSVLTLTSHIDQTYNKLITEKVTSKLHPI